MPGPSRTDLALLSKVVYRNDAIIPPGYEVAGVRDDRETGIFAVVFRQTGTNNYILSYRGTDEWLSKDGAANLSVAAGSWHESFKASLSYAASVKEQFGQDANYFVTGHSNGGAHAQLIGLGLGIQATTFEAPGMAAVALRKEFRDALKSVGIDEPLGIQPGSSNFIASGSLVSDNLLTHLGAVVQLDIPNFLGLTANRSVLRGSLRYSLVGIANTIAMHDMDKMVVGVAQWEGKPVPQVPGFDPQRVTVYNPADIPVALNSLNLGTKQAEVENYLATMGASQFASGIVLSVNQEGYLLVSSVSKQSLNPEFGDPLDDVYVVNLRSPWRESLTRRADGQVEGIDQQGTFRTGTLYDGTSVVMHDTQWTSIPTQPSGAITVASLETNFAQYVSPKGEDQTLDADDLNGIAEAGVLVAEGGATVKADKANSTGREDIPIQAGLSFITSLTNPALQTAADPNLSAAAQIGSFGGMDPSVIASISGGAALNSTFRQAEGGTLFPVDPLILDLDGDGAEAVAWFRGATFFDTQDDGNTRKHHTGWVGADDGLLVHDLNANGTIDGLNELISVDYAGGNFKDALAALASVDADKDGRVDAADPIWSSLRVWRDADSDGITDPGELRTLASLGIVSLSTATTGDRGEEIDGNEVRGRSTYTRADGTVRETVAIDFKANGNAIAETALAGGATLITSFITPAGGGTPMQRGAVHLGAGPNVVDLTAGTVNGVRVTTANGTTIDAAYASTGADRITASATDTRAYWMGGGTGVLHLQGGGGNDVIFANAATLRSGFVNGGGGTDLLRVVGDEGVTVNMAQRDLEVVMAGDGDDVIIGGDVENQFVHGGGGNDVLVGGWSDDGLQGGEGDDYLSGAAGDDVVRGGAGNDLLYGGTGNDLLYGDDGDDLLVGEAGNNMLEGGRGNDTLVGTNGWAVAQFSGSYHAQRRRLDPGDRQARRAGRDRHAGRRRGDELQGRQPDPDRRPEAPAGRRHGPRDGRAGELHAERGTAAGE